VRYAFYASCLVFLTAMQTVHGLAQTDRSTLRPPAAFGSISDPGERSRAIFAEAAKVLTHPRCLNCHPRVIGQRRLMTSIRTSPSRAVISPA
jgi:hypothetical protein